MFTVIKRSGESTWNQINRWRDLLITKPKLFDDIRTVDDKWLKSGYGFENRGNVRYYENLYGITHTLWGKYKELNYILIYAIVYQLVI